MSIREKTLALDDDRDLVEIIRTVLESHGYQVNTANEPQTGLSKAPTDRLDLMLVDVIMPTGTEGVKGGGKVQQGEVVSGCSGCHLRHRQVRIVFQVQPRRPWLDPAQQQVFDRIERDGPQS